MLEDQIHALSLYITTLEKELEEIEEDGGYNTDAYHNISWELERCYCDLNSMLWERNKNENNSLA